MPRSLRSNVAGPCLIVLASALGMSAASAQSSENNSPIKVIVPFAAGTPTDVVARFLAQGMARSLGRPVVVDNKPGAAGSIATEAVAKAPADGATVLMTVNSTVTINPLLYTKLRYDPMKELVPVALVAKGGYALVTSAQSGLHNIGDLVRAAQQRPGKVNYASYGVGSMSHMCAEVFQAITKVKLFHVPYKAGALNDILGGQIDVGFEPIAPAIPFIQQGKINGIAVTSSTRIEALPALPALGETYAGYECTAWVGLLLPAKTPDAIRSTIEAAVLKTAGTPEFIKKTKEMGLEPMSGNASEFRTALRLDHEKWRQVIQPLDLKLD